MLDEHGNIIADGGEAFVKGSILPSIKRLRQEAQNAAVWEDESVHDLDKGYRFEYTKNNCGNVDWQFRSGNNKTMAVGGIAEIGAETKFEQLKNQITRAEVVWEHEEDDPAYSDKSDDRTETQGIPGS